MKLRKILAGVAGTAMMMPLMGMTVMAANTNGVAIDSRNFPDDTFRAYLSYFYDTDKNGYFSDEEIANVTKITDNEDFEDYYYGSYGYDSIDGMEIFYNLEELCLGYEGSHLPNSLDLSHFPKLKRLSTDLHLTELDLSHNPELEELELGSPAYGSPDITTLDLRNNPKLTSVEIHEAPLESIDLSNCVNLTRLVINQQGNSGRIVEGLPEIDVSNCINLVCLSLRCTSLTELELTYNTNLEYLDVTGNNLTELDVSNLSKLFTLNCQENNLSSLDLSNNGELHELFCGWQGLHSLDVSNNPKLVNFWCNNAGLTELDITNNAKLSILACYGNNIASLNISNCPQLIDIYREANEAPEDLIHDDSYNNSIGYYGGYEVSIANLIYGGNWPYAASFNISKNTDLVTNKPVDVSSNPSFNTPVSSFAERLYTCALGRASEKAGKDYWSDALSHGTSGADAAYGFLFSEEVTNANLSDAAFVNRIYATLMDREPAAEETAYWVGCIEDGTMTREDVFLGFVNSQEWANVCVTYGIVSGGTTAPSVEVNPSYNIIKFATRLYTTCLGRDADPAGLKYWAGELANLRITGSAAAAAYFFSEEFVNANVNDREFVNRLYLTFMDRKAADVEFDYWLGEMGKGMTRETVFSGFALSEEFGNICAEYGIIR